MGGATAHATKIKGFGHSVAQSLFRCSEFRHPRAGTGELKAPRLPDTAKAPTGGSSRKARRAFKHHGGQRAGGDQEKRLFVSDGRGGTAHGGGK